MEVAGECWTGKLFDMTEDYTFSFFAMGAVVTLSGAMLYPICCFKKPQQVNGRTEPLIETQSDRLQHSDIWNIASQGL